MARFGLTLTLLAALALPLFASAQTLPPSTADRQEIQNLTYEANLPGTTPMDRAELQRRINQLQYQINTRPLIQPMPTLAPNWNGTVQSLSDLPQFNPNATPVPLGPTIYGSCEANRAVIAYLEQEISLPSTSRQERNYAIAQRNELQKDVKARHC